MVSLAMAQNMSEAYIGESIGPVPAVCNFTSIDGLQFLFQYKVSLQTAAWGWERPETLPQVPQGVGAVQASILGPEWA